MKPIRPIRELGTQRVQEAGKIRMGVKTAKAMKAIDTFRFTSPHRDCIDQLAALYGGQVKPWSDPKASPNDQFEVVTTSSEITVLIPPGGLSTHYELWAGSGNARRCDGERVVTVQPNGEDLEQQCICHATQNMECRPYTRLAVVLPEVTFRGTWTLTTKSWNAAEEMAAMERLIEQLQQRQDIVECKLAIEKRSRVTKSGKKNFVVPVISIGHTVQEIAGGAAQWSLGAGTPALDPTQRALNPAASEDVAEAEVIPDVEELENEVDYLANLLMLDADALEVGVARGASDGQFAKLSLLDDDQLVRALHFLQDVNAQDIEIRGFYEDGRLRIARRKGE